MNEELAKIVEKYRNSPEFSSAVWSDVNTRSISGDTLLHAAVVRGDRADVTQLISLGADVNAAGDLGNTPLHEAASRGSVEIIRKLVAAGSNTSCKNEFGQRPVELARLMHKDKALKNTLRDKSSCISTLRPMSSLGMASGKRVHSNRVRYALSAEGLDAQGRAVKRQVARHRLPSKLSIQHS